MKQLFYVRTLQSSCFCSLFVCLFLCTFLLLWKCKLDPVVVVVVVLCPSLAVEQLFSSVCYILDATSPSTGELY